MDQATVIHAARAAAARAAMLSALALLAGCAAQAARPTPPDTDLVRATPVSETAKVQPTPSGKTATFLIVQLAPPSAVEATSKPRISVMKVSGSWLFFGHSCLSANNTHPRDASRKNTPAI